MKKDHTAWQATGLSAASRTTLLYLLVAGLWIAFSETILAGIAHTPEQMRILSIYNGWAFVLVTGALLFILLRRKIGHLDQKQKRLELRHDLLRGLFDATYDAIVIHDPDSGEIQDMNTAAEKLFGLSREESEGVDIGTICSGAPPYTRDEAIRHIHAARKAPQLLKWQVRRTDGTLLWVEVSLQTTAIQGEERLVAVLRDIEARHQAVEALADSEERFRRAIVASPFPVMIHAEDGAVLSISNSWTEISGYSLEDVPTTQEWTRLAYGQQQASVKADIDALFELDRRKDEGDYTVRTKSGETRIWDFNSAPLGSLPDGRRLVISMAMDMTERKKAEAALEESEEQFRSTITDLQVGVVVHHADTSVMLSNPQARHLLGLTAEQIAGKTAVDPAWNFVHQDLSVMEIEEYPVSQVRKAGEKLSDLTIGIRRPDRKDITWVLASATPVFTEQNRLARIIVNFIDITARKRMEEELANHRTDLEEQIEERTRDLRTMVNAMAGREVRMTELKDAMAALRTQLLDAGIEPMVEGSGPDGEGPA